MPARIDVDQYSLGKWITLFVKVEGDFVGLEIGELNVLRIGEVVLPSSQTSDAVLSERTVSLPNLVLFGGYGLLVLLYDRDCIEEAVRSGRIGNVFRAVGEENVPVDAVVISILGAGELRQIA
jgi:hypothetical protein